MMTLDPESTMVSMRSLEKELFYKGDDMPMLTPIRPLHSEDASRLNVLVVDDQRENLLAVEAILSNLGHNLILVDSGEEALRQILRGDVALVLLDVLMPGMGGFETARFIRN